MAGESKSGVYTRLPALRAERGLSRKELADAVGVHYQTIGYLERGEYNPSLALALRIAEVIDLPVEALFSLTPMEPLSAAVYPRRDANDERP
jgi:DNA-binding XRE family transcriptional regulator